MRPWGWILVVGLACQGAFWLRARAAQGGAGPGRAWALGALAGGLAVAAVAWRDSHVVLLAGQALALAAYVGALRTRTNDHD